MAGKEVAKASGTAVSADVYDYGADAHGGFEGTTVNDLSIPFINVLQSNSPEVEEQEIPGAKAGDLLNSVTKELLKQPVVVQPVYEEAGVVEWVPRNKGGGIAGRRDMDDPEFLEAIKQNNGSRIPPKGGDGKRIPFKSKAGNDLVETYYYYCLVLDESGEEVEGFCVLSFSSTKIKVFKDWKTSMYTIKGAPPLWANRAKLSTQRQKNNDGTFYNYSVAPFGETWRTGLIPPNTDTGRLLLEEGKNFRKMIDDGLAKADFSSMEGKSAEDDTVEGSTNAGTSDDETPF